jgi:hypothetical protein
MVRKQLYITEGQEEVLKDQARRLGISEAELTRRALSEFLAERSPTAASRSEALETLLERTRALSKEHRLPSEYQFDRGTLYSGRTREASGTDQ